ASTGRSWRRCSVRSPPPTPWSAPRSPVTTPTRTRGSRAAGGWSQRSPPDTRRLTCAPRSEPLVALHAEEEPVALLVHAGHPVLAADALRAADLRGGPVGERGRARVERRVAGADEQCLADVRHLDPLAVVDLLRAVRRARWRRPVAFADVAAGA